MSLRPVLRRLILCEKVAPDLENPNRLSLLRVVHALAPKPGSKYPLLIEQLSVFAQITEGRGQGLMWVEVVHADSNKTIFRTKRRSVAFPNEPLLVLGIHFRINFLPFSLPGLHWVQLWFEDTVLIQTPLLLRPIPAA